MGPISERGHAAGQPAFRLDCRTARHRRFVCGSGEITSLEGPNGSGKSTLLGILGTTSFRRPAVRFSTARSGSTPPKCAVEIGWLSHETHCYPDLSPRRNMQLAASLYGAAETRGRSRQRALRRRRVRGAHVSSALTRSAPAGRACARDGACAFVLLLDEPTNGLDTEGVERLVGALREEAQRGSIVVLVTHDAARGACRRAPPASRAWALAKRASRAHRTRLESERAARVVPNLMIRHTNETVRWTESDPSHAYMDSGHVVVWRGCVRRLDPGDHSARAGPRVAGRPSARGKTAMGRAMPSATISSALRPVEASLLAGAESTTTKPGPPRAAARARVAVSSCSTPSRSGATRMTACGRRASRSSKFVEAVAERGEEAAGRFDDGDGAS